jgi:hypothetical protein
MKTKLDLVTKLHYELNLENFFNVQFNDFQLTLLAWNSDGLEKLLFDKGYQFQWNEDYKGLRYENEDFSIMLYEKPIIL